MGSHHITNTMPKKYFNISFKLLLKTFLISRLFKKYDNFYKNNFFIFLLCLVNYGTWLNSPTNKSSQVVSSIFLKKTNSEQTKQNKNRINNS